MFFTSNFNSLNEKGIYIPLAAIITFAVLFTLIGLGHDSSQVHRASALLGQRAEEICYAVAKRPAIHVEVADLFRQQLDTLVNNEPIKGVNIVGGRIIVPTMQAGGCFGFDENTPCLSDTTQVSGTPQSYAALGLPVDPLKPVPSCNFNCTGNPYCTTDCFFQGEVDNTSSYAPDSIYPDTLWNDLQNAGNTVACEIYGTVDTFFHGIKPIKAKTTYRKDLRGSFPIADDPAYPLTQRKPGVSLIIAPQMTTRAEDPRFWFHPSYSNNSFVDPLAKFNQAQASPLFGGDINQYTPPLIPYPTTMEPTPGPYFVQQPKPISPYCQSETNSANEFVASPACNGSTAARNGPFTGQSYNPAAPYKLSDLEEIFVACMNPFVLVRNFLLSGMDRTFIKARPNQKHDTNFNGQPKKLVWKIPGYTRKITALP